LRLSGKRALITGASQGFGLAVARSFVEEGASLMLCARGPEALRRAQEELSRSAGVGSRVHAMQADVAKPEDVRQLVRTTIERLGGIDILVCNAGVYGPKGPFQDVDWDEWVSAIQVNLMGVALVCRETLPHFLTNRSGRILVLSGGGATKPMPNLSAYSASKAAVVRLAETLAEEVRGSGVTVNAIAPGALNTRLLDEVLAAGPEKVGEGFYRQAVVQKAEGGSSPLIGAELCVFLASSAGDEITGKLISAVWDPWRTLSEHIEDLSGSDIYTLRRIVPQDRGKGWG